MRRMVIEADASEISRVSGDKTIDEIKALDILQFIRQDPEEAVVICSIELYDPSRKLSRVIPNSQFEILDHSEQGKYIVLWKGKPEDDPIMRAMYAAGRFMITPLEIKDGKVKMTFFGTAKQVRMMPMMFKKLGIRHKVLQLTDANVAASSPLSSLTNKQRSVLVTAFNLGYYDIPRKVSSEKLASKLGISISDMIKHRRKAEKKIFSELLGSAAARQFFPNH